MPNIAWDIIILKKLLLFIWNSDLSEHLVFLSARFEHITHEITSEVLAGSTVSQDSTEAERAPSELTYVVAGGLQCLVSWGPHFFESCWTEGLSFWPHHMSPSIGLLTTYGLASPSVRSKRWFKWEPLSVLSKSHKWQPILSVIFYSSERSQ